MKRSRVLFFISLFFVSAVAFARESAVTEPLMMYLFSSSTCEQCRQLKEEFLPQILKKFQGAVALQYIPVDDKTGFELQLMYERQFNCESDEAVKLFVGKQCLAGVKDIRSRINEVVAEELNLKSQTITPTQIIVLKGGLGRKQPIAGRFSGFTPGVVAVAGLVDGVNPCAFITLVFFISMLSFLKKTKIQIMIIGGVFALSVFFTYLVLGFGAFKLIKVFAVNSGISRGISLAALLLTAGLTVFNFIDFLRYEVLKDPADIKLKLPISIRKLINHMIRREMRTQNLILGAVILGIVISLLESMCTGQVYLPTIIYILKQKTMFLKSFSYLMLYNIMFIVPLLLVFIFAYSGVSSDRIREFFTKNIAISKLLLALLFLLLTFVLLLNGI